MIYTNPNKIKNIVQLCDEHKEVEGKINGEWQTVILIGIRRFSGDFLFIVWPIRGACSEVYLKEIKF